MDDGRAEVQPRRGHPGWDARVSAQLSPSRGCSQPCCFTKSPALSPPAT